ncbi:MAG TPA: ABC transporter ATP-binding protein [Xanthobacteraceae bacterium]|nr:ABC transporter ATP-binding protein [Xanthobacteraceae bacterium]
MTARLVFRDIGRTFRTSRDTTVAVRGVNLSLERGSFTAMIGRSGCGKSTLLHIAAGLDSGYEGSFAREPAGATVAYLFQQPRLLPWQSARNNVAFVLEARGVAKQEARQRADEMINLVGLSAAAGKFPAQLSGGMQQRVSLARALAVDPDLLLMDEPFSALDELTAAHLREELVSLCAQKERTVLFATHNTQEACYLADRVIVLSAHPGTVVADVNVEASRPRCIDNPRLAEIAAHVRSLIDRSAPSGVPEAAA